jgi:membrane protein involved in colicin uptake
MAILDKLLRRNTMSEVANAIEVNCTTGEVTERELTADELAQREADAKAAADQKAADDKAAADKAAARQAVYAKLGLTADEIAALAD